MTEPGASSVVKLERERRLTWQSRTLLVLVLTIVCMGLSAQLWQGRRSTTLTPATGQGLIVCTTFGVLVWLLRAATPLAAVTGSLLTACLYLNTVDQPDGSWRHTALLPGLVLFALAFAATRFRRGQKEERGLAESRHGRGASQVAANMGAAALAALALRTPALPQLLKYGYRAIAPVALVALVAALAEAAADTVSSEIGQALGGRPFLITSFKRVLPGTDGAISLAGTAAGCTAAAILVLAAIPALRLHGTQAAVAWTAAIGGLFADSLIGATLERRGWLNNDAVNFLSTALSAFLAAAWLRGIQV